MKKFFWKLGYLWEAVASSIVRKSTSGPSSEPDVHEQSLDAEDQTNLKQSRSCAVIDSHEQTQIAASSREEIPPPGIWQEPFDDEQPPIRYQRNLVVGVDFGTSSTKVIWQDLSDNSFELFRWRPDLTGLESVLLPSTVTISDGQVTFGSPDRKDGAIWLESIKLCVLCNGNNSVCRCNGPIAKFGWINVPGLSEPVPATSIACLFLAHVFHCVEQNLKGAYASDDVFLIWNIGCPMDHLDTAESKVAWEKMAGVAMSLKGRVFNPCEVSMLSEAGPLINSYGSQKSDQNFFVQHEGMAAVKAFLESPIGTDQKTIAIVDVGAGTTEVSFFFHSTHHLRVGTPGASYLADSTEPTGGGKIDIELSEVWNCDVDSARQRKELGESVPELPSIGAIVKQYGLTCGQIIKGKKLTAKNDKRYDLFVIGGGGRIPLLRNSLSSRVLPGDFVRDNTRQLTPPPSLRNREDVEAHYDLLANACGLASSLVWDYYPPSQVSALPPQAVGAKKDVDELYPK